MLEMNMKKEIEIEIDVDGVLANMDGSYAPYVEHIIPDFCEEKYVLSWGLQELATEYPEAHKIINSLYCNPDFFKSLPMYPGVVSAMKRLWEVVNGKGKIVIHTHIVDGEELYRNRYNWIQSLKNEADVDLDIEISQGSSKKTRTTSKIIIEDNVNNLYRSNADYKILIRRGHNRNFNENDLGEAKKAFVVHSFPEAVKVVEMLLKKKKVD